MIPALTPDEVTGPSSVELFAELDDLFARFIAFGSDELRHAVVMWVAHAHTIGAYESTPRLAMLSPEKGSGKTRVLEVLALVVPAPLHAVNMSAAALYRVVGERQPTLLMDEADTYLGAAVAKQHEDLRGLINAGHRRGAEVYRTEMTGKKGEVVAFPAFAACALAGIGDLPDTILDRSIVIGMKRRAPHEVIEPFRERKVRPTTSALLARLISWGAANVTELEDAWPDMPEGITDRPADVWEPLLACADAIGGPWPERARTACVTLNAARQDRDPSLGVLMLADCRRIFEARGADRLTSVALVEHLCNLDESPWGDLRGKPVDKAKVARFLKRFDVRPGAHRFEGGTNRGYLLEDFHDAWGRYLSPETAADVTGVTGVTGSQGSRGGDVTAVTSNPTYVLTTTSEKEGPPIPPEKGVTPVTPVTPLVSALEDDHDESF